MMTKGLILVFGLMTAGAIYLTAYDVGVMEPSISKHSVRKGSTHRSGGIFAGGYRGGK